MLQTILFFVFTCAKKYSNLSTKLQYGRQGFDIMALPSFFHKRSSKSMIYFLTAFGSMGLTGVGFWIAAGFVFPKLLSDAFSISLMAGVAWIGALLPVIFVNPVLFGSIALVLTGASLGVGVYFLSRYLTLQFSKSDHANSSETIASKDSILNDVRALVGLTITAVSSVIGSTLAGVFASGFLITACIPIVSAVGFTAGALLGLAIGSYMAISLIAPPVAFGILAIGITSGVASAAAVTYLRSHAFTKTSVVESDFDEGSSLEVSENSYEISSGPMQSLSQGGSFQVKRSTKEDTSTVVPEHTNNPIFNLNESQRPTDEISSQTSFNYGVK